MPGRFSGKPAGFGPLEEHEREAAAYLARLGFGHSNDFFYRTCEVFGWDVVRGLRRDGRLGGVAATWTVPQWFGGCPVKAQAVAMVTVDPTIRAQGLGGALMTGLLEEAQSRNCALSILYPATMPLYSKAGYGRGGVSLNWSAPPSALANGRGFDIQGVIERISGDDAGPLAELRRPMLASENGMVERGEGLWLFSLTTPEGEPAEVFLLGGPAGPEGYIAISPPHERRLVITDMCIPTRRSARLAINLLTGFRTQVDEIQWFGGSDDPLALLAGDSGTRIIGREEWLLRIVNVEDALRDRGYAAGAAGSLTLNITDPLFSGNNGRFRLSVSHGRAEVTRLSRAEGPLEEGSSETVPETGITLSVSALASLYSGHAGADRLRQVGLLGGDDASVTTAARLFTGSAPWMPDRF